MSQSAIEWTDKTWNPVTGCAKVSPGCAHCYAEGVADRFWATQYPPVEVDVYSADNACYVKEQRARHFTDVQTHVDRLDQPLRWKKPARIFVNSMSDLFHESVDYDFIVRVFAVMQQAHRHTFQVLTKRAARMMEIVAHPSFHSNVSGCAGIAPIPWPLSNVWLGVSVENQHFADERVPLLLQTPAAVRFVSYEPALGPVEFSPWLYAQAGKGIDWLIVGGESGRGARPFNLQWARDAISQCRMVGAAPFVKQFGRMPYEGSSDPYAAGLAAANCHLYELDIDKSHGGDMTEWPQDLRIREFPNLADAYLDRMKGAR